MGAATEGPRVAYDLVVVVVVRLHSDVIHLIHQPHVPAQNPSPHAALRLLLRGTAHKPEPERSTSNRRLRGFP